MTQVLIADFQDSFTFNLAELCENWGIIHKVIDQEDLCEEMIDDLGVKSIIWGPGPGHPDEYENVFSLLEKTMQNPKLYHLGICLGHQLIMKLKGHKIVNNQEKKHGQSSTFLVPEWNEFDSNFWGKKVEVQYYSSLGVKALTQDSDLIEKDGLVVSGKGDNYLSFQFHPESVGTSCPNLFFHGWRNLLIQ